MKEHLEESLCSKYPKIFKQRHGTVTESAMFWGVECGDGWYKILDALCSQIQSHIDWSYKNHEFDIKWNKDHPDNQRAVRGPVPQVVAVQVKEKFGGLRFYYDGGDEQIYGMVRMAESWAANTCEKCGETGSIRTGGWVRTLCDSHEEEYQERTTKYSQ